MGCPYRTFAAFQAQAQHLAVMTGGADRQRLLAPLRQFQQGLPGIQLQGDMGLATWHG
ncbi:hypothetical protein D3C77_817170 [compost metagenome]